MNFYDPQVKTAPSLMLVPQAHVLTGLAVSIGITITTVPARPGTRERIAAVILMSVANLALVSMVACVWTRLGPSAASVH